ncbi:MAG: cation:proton antiporter [Tatlockia sp.]|nr:cation:proton antiporter [Tatlockia sp.]
MSHSLPLITTLATALGLALLMGFIAIKLKLPTIVGYLIAGVIIGPFTPGFVANSQIASELAEIGVMLLMFGVGLHFSLEDLLETRKIALPGALLQIITATLMGALIATLWGWSLSHALVFGLALSVASTVVLIRAMESQGLLGSINGQIAVGWLIVEDIAMVLVLVFLPLMAHWFGESETGSNVNGWVLLGLTLFKLTSFLVLMLWIGRWLLPKLLWQITRTGSRELFTLCVIAVAVSIAFAASKLFGISFALGAFFAGMIIRESKFSQRAAEESLPFRDAFAVLFFVAVGMLFNPYIFVEEPLRVLIVVAIIVFGKSLAAALLVLAFRYPLNTVLTVSASLAQIGEFSFILAGHGVNLKLLSVEAQELILAGALISISINPLLFKLIEPLQKLIIRRSPWIQKLEHPADQLLELPISTEEKYLSAHVVLIGYRRVGERIGMVLSENEIPFVIVDRDRNLVEKLRKNQKAAIYGNAAEPSALIQAHIKKAGMLVVATSDTFDIRQMLSIARKLNPRIEIAIRVQNEEEEALLTQEIEGVFFLSERELAKSMSEYILGRFGINPVSGLT